MHTQVREVSRGICIQNDYILLCKANQNPNYFLPGGQKEYCESAKFTLTRELKEELDISIKDVEFKGIIENKYKRLEMQICETNYIFTFSPVDYTLLQSKEKNLVFEWVLVNDLKTLNILPVAVRDIIENVILKKQIAPFFNSNF